MIKLVFYVSKWHFFWKSWWECSKPTISPTRGPTNTNIFQYYEMTPKILIWHQNFPKSHFNPKIFQSTFWPFNFHNIIFWPLNFYKITFWPIKSQNFHKRSFRPQKCIFNLILFQTRMFSLKNNKIVKWCYYYTL